MNIPPKPADVHTRRLRLEALVDTNATAVMRTVLAETPDMLFSPEELADASYRVARAMVANKLSYGDKLIPE